MSATVLPGKFKGLDVYNQSLEAGYQLLPLRFISLDDARYVVTNEVGEFIVLEKNTFKQFAQKQLAAGSDLYNDLKSKHFLIDADSSIAIELLALKYRSKMDRLADFTGLHMFVATLRCDHSCPYCQVSRQSEDRLAFDMSEETARKAIDFTFSSPSPSIKIEFQGGEPLLNFDLIKMVVKEAKALNKIHQRDLQFVIATNLSQITDEILQFALEEDIHFSTSLDGPEDLHVANRPRPGDDSYRKAIDGIESIRKLLGPEKVSALMTTTEASLPRVREIVDEYVRMNFHNIFLRPLSPYGFAMKTKWYEKYDVERWLQFYFEGLNYIIDLNKQGYYMAESYAQIILQKMFSPHGTSYVDLQSPAGIGISAIIFNYDGEVYASDEARMLAEMGDQTFRLGNLAIDTYKEMMLSDALLAPLEQSITESVPGCNDCAFQPYCGSDPSYHHATQKDVVGHKALSGFCKRNMFVMRRIITLMEDDPEAKNILLGWLRV
ncbi:His-Xaa-Ser system radical SAM maturase HxsB [soil metagenome]